MAYFSILKMGAICSSETSIDFQRTTQSYIPEDGTLHLDSMSSNAYSMSASNEVEIIIKQTS
jgi:hypothetical protein